jgi:GNAT superfamily N-acetyltransferase
LGAGYDIRALRDDDEAAVLRLLAVTMGWPDDEAQADFFRWKHRENPFGRSPGWVAVAGGRIVGLRIFMRWEFTDGAHRYRAVRAVDTATHPDHRGQGIFRALTSHALDRLRDEGVAFVFNTPNSQSRPGYLTMGWQEVGRLPVALKVRSPFVLPRLARSRVPAERGSLPTTVGVPAALVVSDAERLPHPDPHGALATPRTGPFLRWRYGFERLAYRAWEPRSGGAVLFRLRRRGRAKELVVNDLLLPPHVDAARMVGRLVKRTRADHALRIAEPGSVEGQLAPPGLGPVLLWRGLTQRDLPPLDRWRLAMGDVELF